MGFWRADPRSEKDRARAPRRAQPLGSFSAVSFRSLYRSVKYDETPRVSSVNFTSYSGHVHDAVVARRRLHPSCLVELLSLLSRFHPIVSTRIACVTQPIGAAIMALVEGPAAIVFAVCHGTGNGS